MRDKIEGERPFSMTVDSVEFESTPFGDKESKRDDFPYFRVKGTFNAMPFESLVGIAVDDTDADFDSVVGPDFYEFWEAQDELFDTIRKSQAWSDTTIKV